MLREAVDVDHFSLWRIAYFRLGICYLNESSLHEESDYVIFRFRRVPKYRFLALVGLTVNRMRVNLLTLRVMLLYCDNLYLQNLKYHDSGVT